MLKPHQEKAAGELAAILSDTGFAYLVGAPRSGKTRTALAVCQQMGLEPLILTKKNAIPGWQSEMDAMGLNHVVTNYEQAKNTECDFEMVILDEAHNVSNRGKPTQRFKDIKRLAWDKPLLCLSGTPCAETPLQLYHQTAISRYGPYSAHKSFYAFFREHGKKDTIWVGGREVEQYRKCRPSVMAIMGNYTVTMTQEDAGIVGKAVDRVHVVSLNQQTRQIIAQVLNEGTMVVGGKLRTFESEMAVRNAVHQIETGAILLDEDLVVLQNCEVLNYLLAHFPPDETALFCHYRSTRKKLMTHYPHVYSSDGHAEGVSTAGFRHQVIVNTGYSGAKHIQRRERGVIMGKDADTVVHHIVCPQGISQDVYNTVSEKRDFNLEAFRKWRGQRR